MIPLVGHEHAELGDDGRIALRADWARCLGRDVLLSSTPVCLLVWSLDVFRSVVDELRNDDHRASRALSARTTAVAIDDRNSLAVPPWLWSLRPFEGAVVLTGNIDRIEIWAGDAWAEMVAMGESSLRSWAERPS